MTLTKKLVLRILVVLVIIGLLSGGIGFLILHNPGDEVTKLRAKVMQLLESNDPKDWAKVTTRSERVGKNLQDIKVRAELARKASETIIEINPMSQIDLINRGAIEEFDGNLEEALIWYNKVAQMEKPTPGVELDRARILRKLGQYEEAKGAISAVVDVFPFESNLELGRLQLETFQPLEAYHSFSRAGPYGDKNEELRQVHEGMMDALELTVAISRNQLERLKRDQGQKDRIRKMEQRIKKLNNQFQKALDQTIKYWRRANPRTREEFAAVTLKVVELINKKEGTNNLKDARKVLSEAVQNDQEYRNFPIYLVLGTVNLRLAYKPNTPSDRVASYLKNAESSYKKALLFDIEEKSVEFEYLKDWKLPEEITQESFQAHLVLRVCEGLLNFPEFWRILSKKILKESLIQ